MTVPRGNPMVVTQAAVECESFLRNTSLGPTASQQRSGSRDERTKVRDLMGGVGAKHSLES